jgi:hypothetical protein
MHPRTRGLLAALILLGATIGLPVTLALTVGDPLHALATLRGGHASDHDIIAILTAIFYLAWASFVIPVIIEITTTITARVTRRTRREIRLPLLGAQHELARTLVSAVLLLAPTVAATATSVGVHPQPGSATLTAYSHSVGDPARHGTGRRAEAAQPTVAADRTYVIPDAGGMRTYWALAEHYLGDGQRWREIWTVNAGRVHTDGTVMDTPRRLFAGWTILIPPTDHPHQPHWSAGNSHDVTAHPGDTLSGLAAADGITDWHQIWPANADRAEPDGQHFVDPDLIRPGWTTTVPDAATPAASHPAPTSTTPAQDRAQRQHRRQGGDRDRDSASRDRGSDSQTPAVAPQVVTAAPSAAPTREDIRTVDPASSNPQQQTALAPQPLPVPLEIGLAAVAVLAVLDRARRIAQRRRRRGHRPLPPPPPLREVEAQLRRDARRTHPAISAIQLATALIAEHPPAVQAVIAGDDGAIDLLLQPIGSETAPPPFVAVPGGWRLPADAAGFSYAVEDTDDPYPALAPIGRLADGEVLISLETLSPISVVGDPATVNSYLAQLVTAIAGAPWSGRIQIHVPTAIADLAGSVDRLVIEDTTGLAQALELAVPAPADSDDMADRGAPPQPVEPGWCTTPVHLFCGWTAHDDIDGLLQAAGDPRRHVLAVINGARPETLQWTLDGNQLTIPSLPDPVTVTIPATDRPTARDLLDYTSTAPDVPVGDPRLPDLTADAPPTSVLVDPLADADPGLRQLNLLGPVELTGVRWLRRGQILNLLTYLALHRRGVDRHQLAAALWPIDVLPSSKTMRNRLTEARSLVGGAITDGPRWRLDGSVTTDWQQFTALAAGTPDEQRQALTLIRGRPFAGLDDADWIDLEGFRSEIEAAIVDLALTIGEHDLDTGAYSAALTATRSGLLASRYEERLHRLAIRAADAAGLTGIVKTLKQEMRTALDLDIEPDEEIQPETLAIYDEMRARPPRVSLTAHAGRHQPDAPTYDTGR